MKRTEILNLGNVDVKILENIDYNEVESFDDKNIISIIFDMCYDEEYRIKCLEILYKRNGNDIIEIISRINGMYYFSGTKSLEKYMSNICNKSNISSFLKFQLIKSLISYEEILEEYFSDDEYENELIKIRNKDVDKRNKKCSENAYNLLNNLCNDKKFEDIETPCKVEAVCLLMMDKNYKDDSLKYFIKIINNQGISNEYRYKCILNLENIKLDLEDINWYLKFSCYAFMNNEYNNVMFRILSGQYLLQKIPDLEEEWLLIINNTILNFALDDNLEYNLRADAADTLMNLSTDESVKFKAREIINILARKFGRVRTIFDNAQNVHISSIEKSIIEAIEFLSSFPTLCLENGDNINFEYVQSKINDLLKNIKNESRKNTNEININSDFKQCKYCDSYINSSVVEFCNEKCIKLYKSHQNIEISLLRIQMDRALYSKYNQSLSNILIKLWTYINQHNSFNDMQTRLLEELDEMSGTCSTGFASRLINVISGYGDFSIKITWEDQIISNFVGRLNASVKKITDPSWIYYTKYYIDLVKIYLNENKLEISVEKYLSENRDEKIKDIIENFSENVLMEMMLENEDYNSRKNFMKFFVDNIPYIREELYKEFKEFVNDVDFDMACRKAIANYEGLQNFI
jgi:hypothetical protein